MVKEEGRISKFQICFTLAKLDIPQNGGSQNVSPASNLWLFRVSIRQISVGVS